MKYTAVLYGCTIPSHLNIQAALCIIFIHIYPKIKPDNLEMLGSLLEFKIKFCELDQYLDTTRGVYRD